MVFRKPPLETPISWKRSPLRPDAPLELSSDANIAVAPAITVQPASQNIANGQTATVSVTATGTAPLTYQWYTGNSGDTSNPIGGATNSSYTSGALTNEVKYWVRVTNAAGSVDSNTATMTVTPLAPTLSSPASGARQTTATPVLDWGDVSEADTYKVRIDNDSGFGSIDQSANGLATSDYTVSPALAGGKWYWQAAATNGAGDSAWSSARNFIVPYVYDTFTAANGTNLSGRTPDITAAAATWTVRSGTWDIQSNQANRTSATNHNYAVLNAGVADVACEFVYTQGGTSDAGMILRDDGTDYFVLVVTNVSLILYEFDGVSTFTNRSSSSQTTTGTHTIRAECNGSTITVYFDGASVITYNSATRNQTATNFGIRESGASSDFRFDNFGVWAL